MKNKNFSHKFVKKLTNIPMPEKEKPFLGSPEVSKPIELPSSDQLDSFIFDAANDFELAADRLLNENEEILNAAQAVMDEIDVDAMAAMIGEDEEDDDAPAEKRRGRTTVVLRASKVQETMGGDPSFSMSLLVGAYEAILRTELKPKSLNEDEWKEKLNEMKKNAPDQYYELLLQAAQEADKERNAEEVENLIRVAENILIEKGRKRSED